MMIRRAITWFAVVMLSTAAGAQQVTFQHGRTLSDLINNLYGGNGIQLADTGHNSHFGQTGDFQNFTKTLQAVMQSRSFFPIPSAVGLVSFRFNEATGTYDRVEGSLGPILAERGSTSGKNNLNVSVTYTFADYHTIAGQDTTELVLHHCMTDACTFGHPEFPYLQDTVNIDLHFRMKSQALALSVVYGLTNRLDVGIVVPYIRNDLQVFTHAFVVISPGSSTLTHHFDPNVETSDQYGTATAIGIGDIVARGKLRLNVKGGVESALLTDIVLPSGQKENFLGNGHVKLRETYILSKSLRRFTPHLNLAYEATFGETNLNAFDYRFGTEIMASPGFTISTDVIGVVRPKASSLFRSAILQDQLLGRSEIDGTIGGKVKLGADRAFLFNVLAPLNKSGIRPGYVVTAGVQMTM